MAAGSGGSSKAVAWGIGIFIVLVVVFIFYKLNEISEKVDMIADNQNARPIRDNAPIDVTPEAVAESVTPSAIVAKAPLEIRAETRIHSAESTHSDQNAPKTLKNPVIPYIKDSEVSQNALAESFSKSTSDWNHSEDFRMVTAFGKTHSLTLYQSRAIEKLWKAWKSRVPELHQAAILEGIDSCSKRLRDVFKSNMVAYRALIQPGERKGTFKLNLV